MLHIALFKIVATNSLLGVGHDHTLIHIAFRMIIITKMLNCMCQF